MKSDFLGPAQADVVFILACSFPNSLNTFELDALLVRISLPARRSNWRSIFEKQTKRRLSLSLSLSFYFWFIGEYLFVQKIIILVKTKDAISNTCDMDVLQLSVADQEFLNHKFGHMISMS